MSAFASGPDDLLAFAKRDADCCEMVAALIERRFAADSVHFENLLWLLAARAMCVGAHAILEDFKTEAKAA
jgi:hypothetical protein